MGSLSQFHKKDVMKLRILADWFDFIEKVNSNLFPNSNGNVDVQRDLRDMANRMEDQIKCNELLKSLEDLDS